MRRILLILIVNLASIGLNAQTKEETEKFIAKCMREAVGLKTYSVRTNYGRAVEKIYEQNEFELNKIFTKTAIVDYAKGSYKQQCTYTNVVWANVVSVVLDTIPSLFHEDDVATIRLDFSTKIKEIDFCEGGTYNVDCSNTDYWDFFTLIIPRNRAVACKKAFAHLVKLCKEENKSPFDN
jgi:hypothetical protein